MRADMWGMFDPYDPAAEDMIYPVRCRWCSTVQDAARVKVVHRYQDCTTWRCPGCRTLIDDRPQSWGGSAIPVERSRR